MISTIPGANVDQRWRGEARPSNRVSRATIAEHPSRDVSGLESSAWATWVARESGAINHRLGAVRVADLARMPRTCQERSHSMITDQQRTTQDQQRVMTVRTSP